MWKRRWRTNQGWSFKLLTDQLHTTEGPASGPLVQAKGLCAKTGGFKGSAHQTSVSSRLKLP